MEPNLQYANTSDDVKIAYWALGAGPPLVYLPPMPGHVLLEWESEVFGGLYRTIAERYQLIRFDFRNSGLSQHAPDSSRLDSAVLDLEAVAGQLRVDRLSIWAQGPSGHSAIAFAAARPERVDGLVLSECFASFADIADVGQVQALTSLCERDFDTFTETMGNIFFGWDAQSPAREFAALLRASVTHEQMNEGMAQFTASDVTALLPAVRARTLVLHHRGAQLVPQLAATKLASAIAGARLVLLEGDTVAGPAGDPVEAAAIDEFLLGTAAPARPMAATPSSGTVTILFTDLASSTALTQRLGDAKAQELVRAHNTIVREALASQGGTEIKHTGDGIMASFLIASGALECATAIQRAVALRDDTDLQVHIGLNAGEPVAEESDLFGTSVQLARRICDHASAGQILVSNVVRELAAGKGFLFADIGEVVPKGFEDPVRLYEVRWRGV